MNANGPEIRTAEPCRILSLDGGGAKGFCTLGVLKQLEAIAGPLHERFDLIFGTSTGAIIAALLALGRPVDEVHRLYRQHVPVVMRRPTKTTKAAALKRLATDVFEDKKFTDVKTSIGIVATRWAFERPMIFKHSVAQVHGRHATFIPGFGCTIADAVRASCSAYPFFLKTQVETTDGPVLLIDGGYCANNPTLYAIADGVKAFGRAQQDLRVVSIGVGVYPEPTKWKSWFYKRFVAVQLLQKTLNVNTTSMEQLRVILFKDVPTVRINDTFESPDMATDLLESNLAKLTLLYQRGSESFAKHEQELRGYSRYPMPGGSLVAIPEAQLETWSGQGAVAGSAATYQTVRNALLTSGTGYAGRDIQVFLQGSYGNDTNIYVESDVDVVIRLDDTFYRDLSLLTAEDRALYDAHFGPATYSYDAFKTDVVKALRAAFGAAFVEEGPKAVWIKPYGNRRSADVIVAAEYRRYYSFRGEQNQSYASGICFWSGHTQIINYPKQHSANCTAKHQATNGWFKPMVRILKNMRTRMIEAGAIENGIAPSYFLEGLLYNVPNDKFGSSYEDMFVGAYNWIIQADKAQFVCANEQYYLLRDNDQVTWPTANGKKLLDELSTFWSDWD